MNVTVHFTVVLACGACVCVCLVDEHRCIHLLIIIRTCVTAICIM